MQHFAEFLSNLKDQFYFCKNVTESISRAAEQMPGILRKRLEEICFLLEEEDMRTALPEETLSGCGRFLKLFLVQCRSAVQYGSGKKRTESVFVRNMTELRRDVQNESYQRLEAMYLFSGMGVIAVLPVFFLPFIKWFGNSTMEEMKSFYEGEVGRAVVAIFFLITFVCYALLVLVRQSDKRMYRRPEWIKRLFSQKDYCRWAERYRGSKAERKGGKALSYIGIDGNGMQYWTVCGLCGIVMAIFGGLFFPAKHVAVMLLIILGSMMAGIGAGMGFYKYLGYLRKLGMRGEVLALQSIVLLLADVPNITIMRILDVLGDCGELFQGKMLRCADEYATEDTTALEYLVETAEHPSFRELIIRIQASERIGIKAAFEDLAADRSFYREQIRLDRKQEQKKKAGNAQIMVFLPMFFLLFAYLIIPFLGISMKQMSEIFREMEQIRHF